MLVHFNFVGERGEHLSCAPRLARRLAFATDSLHLILIHNQSHHPLNIEVRTDVLSSFESDFERALVIGVATFLEIASASRQTVECSRKLELWDESMGDWLQ